MLCLYNSTARTFLQGVLALKAMRSSHPPKGTHPTLKTIL
ncbi:hypothetical protein EVA_13854 [gut metagenome]|uniref:Uncharacterized protein n=1 Tax=gut metagenome TaxID=749906 RepID=J9GFD6_9ZZZZ